MHKKNCWGAIFLCSAVAGFAFFSWEPWLRLEHIHLFSTLTLRTLLTSFFEASLVGALADWFAVTALFRRPLGLALPHTDILANKKDALAEAVPRFLAGFLRPETLSPLIQNYDFTAKLEELVLNDTSKFETVISDGLLLIAEHINAPAIIAAILTWAQRGGHDDRLISRTVELARKGLVNNRTSLVGPLTQLVKKNAGWKGLFVGTNTVEKMLDGIDEELSALRDNSDHELRIFIKSSLADYAGKIATADSTERNQLSATVGNTLRSPRLSTGLGQTARDFVQRLHDSPAFRDSLNAGIAKAVISFLEKSKIVEKATASLAVLLKKTEAREFVQRVEEAVWNDLQYIRVNGAVIGGLAGAGIAVLQALLGKT